MVGRAVAVARWTGGRASASSIRVMIRALGRLRLTQVKSSRAESSRIDWIGLARRRRLAWAKARFAGGLEMKLQPAGRRCCSRRWRRRCIFGRTVGACQGIRALTRRRRHAHTVRQVRYSVGKHGAGDNQVAPARAHAHINDEQSVLALTSGARDTCGK